MNLIAHDTQSEVENILDSCPIVISLLYHSTRSSHGGASRWNVISDNTTGADLSPFPDPAAGKDADAGPELNPGFEDDPAGEVAAGRDEAEVANVDIVGDRAVQVNDAVRSDLSVSGELRARHDYGAGADLDGLWNPNTGMDDRREPAIHRRQVLDNLGSTFGVSDRTEEPEGAVVVFAAPVVTAEHAESRYFPARKARIRVEKTQNIPLLADFVAGADGGQNFTSQATSTHDHEFDRLRH